MRQRLPLALALATAFAAPAALAAGGHHAVDDAAILEAGECEVEGWFSRARGGERLVHAGTGCRVGPVELGVAGEYARFEGQSATGWGLELKWATAVTDDVSVGFSVAPAWQARVRPRYQGTAVVGLATWTPHEDWALHLNIGRDLLHRADDETRYGIAAEWSPAPQWTLLAERFRESGAHYVRAGVRWALRDDLSVDLSRAHRLRGPGESAWTLGITWLLSR